MIHYCIHGFKYYNAQLHLALSDPSNTESVILMNIKTLKLFTKLHNNHCLDGTENNLYVQVPTEDAPCKLQLFREVCVYSKKSNHNSINDTILARGWLIQCDMYQILEARGQQELQVQQVLLK